MTGQSRKTNSARCTTHTWSTWYTSYWAEVDKHATQTNSRSYTQCQEGTLLSTLWRVRNTVTTRFCVFWNADWRFLNRNRSIPCKTIYASGTNNPALTNSHNFLSKESTRYFLTVLGESDAYIPVSTHKWPLASSAHTPSADPTLSADGNKSELLIHNNYSARNVAAIIATSIQIMSSLQISASADCQNTHHRNWTLNPPGHSIGCQNQHPHFGKCKLEGGSTPTSWPIYTLHGCDSGMKVWSLEIQWYQWL